MEYSHIKIRSQLLVYDRYLVRKHLLRMDKKGRKRGTKSPGNPGIKRKFHGNRYTAKDVTLVSKPAEKLKNQGDVKPAVDENSMYALLNITSVFKQYTMAEKASSPVAVSASGASAGATAATPKKTTAWKTSKARAKPTHPKTAEMVNAAIKALKERGGSSLQAIKKYMANTYKINTEKQAPFIKRYLKAALASGVLVQTKGKGAAGSFKLSSAKLDSAKPKAKPAARTAAPKKAAAAKKPATAKKPAVVKKAPVKKSVAKKAAPSTKTAKVTKGPAAELPKAKTNKAKPAAKTPVKKAKIAAPKNATKSATAKPTRAAPKKAAAPKK